MAARRLHESAASSRGSKPKGKPRGKPYPPGVSGNPSGKSPDQAERDRLLDAIASNDALSDCGDGTGRSNALAAFQELRFRGMAGDTTALVRYLEWVLGKPKERVSVEGLAIKLCRREVGDADAFGGGGSSLPTDSSALGSPALQHAGGGPALGQVGVE